MPPLPIVLLPGLDGTGDLFEPLVKTAPHHLQPVVIRLPPLTKYAELFDAIRGQLPEGRFAIVGESFSGPLAMRVAGEYRDRVIGVVLVNSFTSPPMSSLMRFFPWSLLFALPVPRWVIRRFFVGRDAPPALVESVRAAVRQTPRRVLAGRMREVFNLPRDSPPLDVPLLVLHGSRDSMVHSREGVSIDAPHLVLQTNPVDAWREIGAFLRDD